MNPEAAQDPVLWCRHLQEHRRPLHCKHVRVQHMPLWCTYCKSRRSTCYCCLGTAKAPLVQCVQVQLRSLWCRHLPQQDQHRPLLSRHVQVQLRPVCCGVDTSRSSTGLCSVVMSMCSSGLCSVDMCMCSTGLYNLDTSWCNPGPWWGRHVHVQHRPLYY
jgi:hypothetical protein